MWHYQWIAIIISLNAFARAEILPRGPPPPLPKAITKFANQLYDVILLNLKL